MSDLNYSLDFELSDNHYLSNLFGVDDKNIQIIEKNNNVQIKYSGNKIKIIGTKTSIKDTKEEILLLFDRVKQLKKFTRFCVNTESLKNHTLVMIFEKSLRMFLA